MSLLKVVRPAEAYVRQHQPSRGRRVRRGAVWANGPGWGVFGPRGSKPPRGRQSPADPAKEPVPAGPSRWEGRTRDLESAHRQAVERGARELLRSEATVVPTSLGPLRARLVRFWNGTGILDCELPSAQGAGGRSFSLVDRRELKEEAPSRLSGQLMSAILARDHGTHGDLWGPLRRSRDECPRREDGCLPLGCDPPGTGCHRAEVDLERI